MYSSMYSAHGFDRRSVNAQYFNEVQRDTVRNALSVATSNKEMSSAFDAHRQCLEVLKALQHTGMEVRSNGPRELGDEVILCAYSYISDRLENPLSSEYAALVVRYEYGDADSGWITSTAVASFGEDVPTQNVFSDMLRRV